MILFKKTFQHTTSQLTFKIILRGEREASIEMTADHGQDDAQPTRIQ